MPSYLQSVIFIPRTCDKREPTDMVGIALFRPIRLFPSFYSDGEEGKDLTIYTIAVMTPPTRGSLNGAHSATDGHCDGVVARITGPVLAISAVDQKPHYGLKVPAAAVDAVGYGNGGDCLTV